MHVAAEIDIEDDIDRRALAADPEAIRTARILAARAARKFPRLADDFESEALLAVVQAAGTFDPGRKVEFATHAAGRVRGALLTVQRRSALAGYRRTARRRAGEGEPRVVSLETRADPDSGPTPIGATLAAGDLPVGWEAEYHDELEALARRLPPGYAAALRLRFGRADCDSHKRTGRVLGLCESRVCQMIAATPMFLHLHPRPTREEIPVSTPTATPAPSTNGVPEHAARRVLEALDGLDAAEVDATLRLVDAARRGGPAS